ncbi:cytochrome C oxidase subunit IV family protein [Mycobacterium avium]|uniref:cytochrome C oxidase subunit IV family protein n=1 Tax=Mycobacterium avium TaxID=1764 RepID=UPI0009FDEEAC|nr:cytochrome C oxidase subunit IV family protein [Mycobacterium avium]
MTATRRITTVWVALLALTLASFLVGIEQGAGATSLAAIVIIAVALCKVRLIGVHFMDLRVAPRALRLIFEGYVFAVFIALAVIDLTSS